MNRVKKPKISVLVLSYNHLSFIEQCIASVFANRSDGYGLELIVLDDGSDDGTIELLKEIKNASPIEFKLILKVHSGVASISGNMNEMIELASGDFICFLASDDEYTLDRFADQLEILQNDDCCIAVYGNGANKKSGKILGNVHPNYMLEMFMDPSGESMLRHVITNVSKIFTQGGLFRAEFIKDYRPYDADLIADDWVFNIKILRKAVAEKKTVKYVNKPLFIRNLHDANISHDFAGHFLRVRQVAERYTLNPRYVVRRVLVAGLVDSVLSLDLKKFYFFIKKSIGFPSSIPLALVGIGERLFKWSLRQVCSLKESRY